MAAKTIDPFQAAWQKFHPDSAPVGGALQVSGTWNLTRFHLLPHGRDAVLSRGDFHALLNRFNTMASTTLGDGTACWFAVPDAMGPEGQPLEADPIVRARFRRLKKRYDLQPRWDFYSTADSCFYKVEATPIVWQPHAFDRLFISIYHERLNNAVFMNAETGAVLAPYSCGVYVSQPTPEALMAVISNHYGWLPDNGDGLLRFDPKQMARGSFELSKPCAAALQRALGT